MLCMSSSLSDLDALGRTLGGVRRSGVMMRMASADRPRRFLGWDTVVAGAGLQLLQSALFFQSFGVYVVVWADEFGWSRGAISSGYALVTLLSGTLGPLHGALLDRFGVRRVVLIGLVVLTFGLLALSTMTSLTTFYLAMLLSGLGLSASGFLSITTAIVPWFVRRRSSALAFMSIGISAGGLLVPLVAAGVVEIGWRSALQLSAVLILVAGLPLALLMRRPPEAYGQHADGVRITAPVPAGGRGARAQRLDHTLAEALRTRAFWLLGIGHAAALLVVSAVTVHLVAHVSEGRGFSLQQAATAVALVTLTSAGGQIVGGPLGDRLDKRAIAAGAMLVHGAALLLLSWGPGWFAVVAFSVLHGFAWGVRGPLMGSLRADYFGAAHFGAIMGASMMVFMVGQLIGPVLAGTLADLLGDYRIGFSILAVLASVASLSFWFATPPPAPLRHDVAARGADGA
jgi:MFS family permease